MTVRRYSEKVQTVCTLPPAFHPAGYRVTSLQACSPIVRTAAPCTPNQTQRKNAPEFHRRPRHTAKACTVKAYIGFPTTGKSDAIRWMISPVPLPFYHRRHSCQLDDRSQEAPAALHPDLVTKINYQKRGAFNVVPSSTHAPPCK